MGFSLRGLYDAIEGRATPVVEDVVGSERFGEVSLTVKRVRRAAGRRVEAVTAGALHLVNLPAGSDVRRLRRQLGDLDFEVRQLRLELAARERRSAGGAASPGGSGAGPRTGRTRSGEAPAGEVED